MTTDSDAEQWFLRREEPPTRDRVPTVSVERMIVGSDDVPLHDPAEDFHEASRLDAGVVDPLVGGALLIERSAEIAESMRRSVKRHGHLPAVALPGPELGDLPLADAILRRRSRRSYGDRPLDLAELATVLHAAYGVTAPAEETSQALRAVPSGGALYPLELYVACGRVSDAEQALYHYDPLRHVLERLRAIDFAAELAPLTPYPELLEPSAAVIGVTAMFWRSRFKYGARAYRFALLEAGHVGQSLLLAAAALGLAAVPVGGFYDRRVDGFLGVDGLYESSLYLLPVAGLP